MCNENRRIYHCLNIYSMSSTAYSSCQCLIHAILLDKKLKAIATDLELSLEFKFELHIELHVLLQFSHEFSNLRIILVFGKGRGV